MNRLGRFVGTMVGEKLQQLCEALLAAEATMASASVSSVCSKISRTRGHPSSKYDVQDKIGETATSTTRIGTHRVSGKTFAIKEERKAKEASIWEEMELLGQFSHENVIKLQEAFEDNSYVYTVLDFCSGGSVTSRAADMVGVSMGGVMRQMADVLKYIHGQNICHRDIHPDHYLLEESTDLCDARVKLIDFTTAKEFSNTSPMMTALRSSEYSAPELKRLDQGASYTECIDVWSLALVFYFMVCGALPFDEADLDDGEDDVSVIPFEPPELWSPVPPMKELIFKMLVVDAKTRLSSEQVFDSL